MRAACAALLGASLALGASAADAESVPFKAARRRVSPPRATLTETTTHELDTSAWPLATMPAFTATSAPSPLPAPPPELRAIDTSAPPPKKDLANPWQQPAPPPTPRPRSTTVYRVEPTMPGLFLAGWSPQTDTHSTSFTFACGDGSRGNRYVFYWELLQRTGKDTAKLTLGETWIDPTTCQLGNGARAEVSLFTAATLDGGPVAFGARTERGLLLFFPQPSHFSLSTAEVGPRGSQMPHGVLSQALIPVRKGDAVVASVSLFAHSVNTWRYAFAMQPLETTRVSHLPLSVRVDVSQSIREETPLALLTLQRPVADEAPPGLASVVGQGNLGLSGIGGHLVDPFSQNIGTGVVARQTRTTKPGSLTTPRPPRPTPKNPKHIDFDLR